MSENSTRRTSKRKKTEPERYTDVQPTKKSKTQQKSRDTKKKSPYHIADLKYFRKLTAEDMEDDSIQDIYLIKKLKTKKDVDMMNLDNYMVFNRELAIGRLFPTPNKKRVLPGTLFDKNAWRYTRRNNGMLLPKIREGGKTKKYRSKRR